jgi:dTDP-4-dehydrorhamnose 3,5-epimerase
MMRFDTETFEIDGPLLIKPKLHSDHRGYFYESYSRKELAQIGIQNDFVQDNQAFSIRGILRGLHFQKPPFAQAKLVRVVRGAVLDIAVDLRPESSHFGRYIMVTLTAENHHQFFIPPGFAHGYLSLGNENLFLYKCDSYYAPGAEGGIRYDDPKVNIQWPEMDIDFILSEKDLALPYLHQL